MKAVLRIINNFSNVPHEMQSVVRQRVMRASASRRE